MLTGVKTEKMGPGHPTPKLIFDPTLDPAPDTQLDTHTNTRLTPVWVYVWIVVGVGFAEVGVCNELAWVFIPIGRWLGEASVAVLVSCLLACLAPSD